MDHRRGLQFFLSTIWALSWIKGSFATLLSYDRQVDDIPSIIACGDVFTGDHSMICQLGGFVTQRHNELRDLEAEFLSTVCRDIEIEPVRQDISEEQLSRGSNI